MFPTHNSIVRNSIFRILLLLVIAWPGPKPMLHSHSQLARSASFSGGYAERILVMHLARFHSTPSSDPMDPDQLHVHWLIFTCDTCDQVDIDQEKLVVHDETQPVKTLLATQETSWSFSLCSYVCPGEINDLHRLFAPPMDGRISNRSSVQLSCCILTC